MARKRARPVEQLELKEPPTAPPAGRGPIVLILGPRNWGIAQWINDEGDVPVYRITQRDIRRGIHRCGAGAQAVREGEMMLDRRGFLGALGLLAIPLGAEGQPAGKVPRVGFLAGSTPHPSPRTNAFVMALRDFGYVEGQNFAVEWRASGGRAERVPDLAAELVRLNVDVIVAVDNPSIAAAQKATRAIPIVMVLATDPVNMGFVGNLARPGGNTTGLTNQGTDLQGKTLQLLKEAIPSASRVAVLWNPAEPERRAHAREAEMAARVLGLHAQLVGAASSAELDRVFTAMARERSDAVLVQPSHVNFLHRARIAELGAKRLLPTIGWSAETVEAGLLMSYGPNILSLHRRAAYYVDKLLRGVKPADLPVEQPTKFELVINLKTAKALGLTIPPSLLARADQVIE